MRVIQTTDTLRGVRIKLRLIRNSLKVHCSSLNNNKIKGVREEKNVSVMMLQSEQSGSE